MRRAALALLAALLLALVGVADAQNDGRAGVSPIQNLGSHNRQVTSAANTAVTITIDGAAHQRVHLSGITARCSAGSAQLTVTDGGALIWSSDSAFVGTSTRSVAWTPKPLATAMGNALAVTLGTCGSGNTGTLAVQAERF